MHKIYTRKITYKAPVTVQFSYKLFWFIMVLSVVFVPASEIVDTSNIHAVTTIRTQTLTLIIDHHGANPVFLKSFYPGRDNPQTSIKYFSSEDMLRFKHTDTLGVFSEIADMNKVVYDLRYSETDSLIVLHFASRPIYRSVVYEKTYQIPRYGYSIALTINSIVDSADTVSGHDNYEMVLKYGKDFLPVKAEGFSGGSQVVQALFIDKNNVERFSENKNPNPAYTLYDQWAGFRNRFWALMVKPVEQNFVVMHMDSSDFQPMLFRSISSVSGSRAHTFQIYAGPLDYFRLGKENPQLKSLLFSTLWFWMRWICIGLLLLLQWLLVLIQNQGLAIIALSLCVKVLMAPLVKVADLWQADVNKKKSLLQPFSDRIKAQYKGEEQNRRILELYKQHKIHPLYALRSLLGVMVQIPIFIAAYHMLSENVALCGVPFLWIDDLALPDRLFAIPYTIPFFGHYVNLLPFCMTGITLLTSWKFRDSSLSPQLLKKQRVNLYWMSALFFILFYTFPAGMVLYWTINNLLALIKTQGKRAISLIFSRG